CIWELLVGGFPDPAGLRLVEIVDLSEYPGGNLAVQSDWQKLSADHLPDIARWGLFAKVLRGNWDLVGLKPALAVDQLVDRGRVHAKATGQLALRAAGLLQVLYRPFKDRVCHVSISHKVLNVVLCD